MRVERIQPDFHSEDEVFRIKSEIVNEKQDGIPNGKVRELPGEKVSQEELNQEVDQLNSAMEFLNRKFHFQIHEQTQRVIVQVLNSETGEVVNEIPPEKFLDMLANMGKAIGIIVDQKA